METVTASRQSINLFFDTQHPVNPAAVADIIRKLDAGEQMDPILVVADVGNGYIILDGHHRAAAYREYGASRIAAWVVGTEDFQALLDAYFGGEIPGRLSDLDDYILVGGEPYGR
jgi:ParB-like chromosome segregation protein Spo0J